MIYEKNLIFPLENILLTSHNRKGFPEGLLRLDYTSGVDKQPDWAMVRPPAPDIHTWAIVLHGHGGKGNQLYVRPDLRQFWLPELLNTGWGILTPTLRGNSWMCPEAVADMDALIQFLKAEYSADRFVFTSGSMGATGSLIYGGLHPENVSAVLARGAVSDLTAYHAFCNSGDKRDETGLLRKDIARSLELYYGGTPADAPGIYRTHSPLFLTEGLMQVPIFLIHGTEDPLMPVCQSRRLAGTLADHPHFAYMEVPGANHDIPLLFGLTDDTSGMVATFSPALKWISTYL